MNLPIANWATVLILGLLALGIANMAVAPKRVWRRRTWVRVVAGLLTLVLLLLTGAAWFNMHYKYYRTLGNVLGRTAKDTDPVDVRPGSKPPPHGQVLEVTIPATKSGFAARQAFVYLPPAWFVRPRPQLPAILLLGGTPGQMDDWTRAGEADDSADAFAARNGGQAPILIVADENGDHLRTPNASAPPRSTSSRTSVTGRSGSTGSATTATPGRSPACPRAECAR